MLCSGGIVDPHNNHPTIGPCIGDGTGAEGVRLDGHIIHHHLLQECLRHNDLMGASCSSKLPLLSALSRELYVTAVGLTRVLPLAYFLLMLCSSILARWAALSHPEDYVPFTHGALELVV